VINYMKQSKTRQRFGKRYRSTGTKKTWSRTYLTKLFYFCTFVDKHPVWNDNTANRTSIDDVPQLEYDENDMGLIADRGKSIE
jgi:hypothetical protein